MANQFLQKFASRLFSPPSNTIPINPTAWPNPLQPIAPVGPTGSTPMSWPFWQGNNLSFTPRADAEYSSVQLRAMAKYPLARICIENVKDQIGRLDWQIQSCGYPEDTESKRRERDKEDPNIIKLTEMFNYPDGEHAWTEWIRPLMEEMLVIDAASILVRRTLKGRVAELRVLPGHNIIRYIDAQGFTPKPPAPAYAQLWEGLPRVNLSTDQLIYRPRNIVPRNTNASYLYGFSPIEQLADELQIGILRLAFVTAYYSEGAVPGVVQVVPPQVPVDKIKEAMVWMNSELSGNLSARRQWRMIQGFQADGKQDQILFTKEPLLADAFDEMHIRKVAFGLGTSPQRLQKAMNRGSAKQGQDAANEEGMRPWIVWVQSFMNFLIQRTMRMPHYELIFNTNFENDMVKKATADGIRVDKGLNTRNEIRRKNGEDPRPEPEADQLGITTTNGFVAIGTKPEPATEPKPSTVEPKPEPKQIPAKKVNGHAIV